MTTENGNASFCYVALKGCNIFCSLLKLGLNFVAVFVAPPPPPFLLFVVLLLFVVIKKKIIKGGGGGGLILGSECLVNYTGSQQWTIQPC